MAFGLPAHADYVPNGSFKDGLANWATAQNSGAATFTAATVDPKAGSTLLRVLVSNAGDPSNFPRLTCNTSVTAHEADTFTISFFARCPESKLDHRPAKLRIHLDGGSTTHTYDYQPFEKWQEFHYSFKTVGTVSFSITFEAAGTYELNRILLVDQNEPTSNNQAVIDTPTSYLWQWGQQAYAQTHQDAVIGTDNDIAQQLPDGRVAWIFNDTNLGPLDLTTNYRGGNSNSESSMVRNCIVVQNGDALTLLKPKEAFVPPDHRHLFWPTDATIEDGKLRVLVEETNPSNLAGLSSSLVSLKLPELTEDTPSLVKVPWSGEILDGYDGYFYIYDDRLGPARKVARVPVGSLSDANAWTFYNGNTWVADKSAAIPLGGLASAPNAGASFERLGPNNFVAMSYGRQGDTIGVHFAPTPIGPWTNYTSIYTVPHEESQFYYDPHIYKHSNQNGVYSVGFSDYSWGWDPGKPFDKCYYWPQFIKTPNLLAMSPYTSGTFRDDFTTTNLTNWQIDGGHWNKKAGSFEVDTIGSSQVQALAKGMLLNDFVFDVNVQTGAADSFLGVVFRSVEQTGGSNVKQGYFAALVPDQGVVLSKVENGRLERLAANKTHISAETAYHLKVSTTGATIKVFVTDMVTPLLTVQDTAYPTGGVGLRADNGRGCFRDVAITNQCYEAEDLIVAETAGPASSKIYETKASAGAAVTFAASTINDHVTFKLPQVSPGRYRVNLRIKQELNGGISEASIGASLTTLSTIGEQVDTYQEKSDYLDIPLGMLNLDEQQDEFLRLNVTGKNAASTGYCVTVDSIKLTPVD